MENYETLRIPELRALARGRELRGYSRLRKAELITLLRNNEQPQMGATWKPARSPPMEPTRSTSAWEPSRSPQREPELTKRQRKHRRARDSKLAKKFKSLEAEYNNLKSRMEELEDKITRAYQSTNAKFK